MSNMLCCASLRESADRECQALDILAGLRLCESLGVGAGAGLGWLQQAVFVLCRGWWLPVAISAPVACFGTCRRFHPSGAGHTMAKC